MTTYSQTINFTDRNIRKNIDVDSLGTGQLVYIDIFNNTQYSLSLVRKNLEWGGWDIEPPSIIKPYSEIYFASRGTLFGGIEGDVDYSLFGASLNFHWSLSFWGATDYKLTVNDPKSLYDIYFESFNAVSIGIYVTEKSLSKRY